MALMISCLSAVAGRDAQPSWVDAQRWLQPLQPYLGCQCQPLPGGFRAWPQRMRSDESAVSLVNVGQ